MNILKELRNRFRTALTGWVDDPEPLVAMIRPAQDARHGDYQANCAMPMKKIVGGNPREIAQELAQRVALDDLCSRIEIAGPGFVNLTLDDQWLSQSLATAYASERLGVEPVENPRTVVVDFSSPNVAKPMHVGHIRSTVIGDALARVLRFVGHQVITDNHLGDWGTQFGMIIYGYKHFADEDAYRENPIQELGRLYRLVRQLIDYHSAASQLPNAEALLQRQLAAVDRLKQELETADDKTAKKIRKDLGRLQEKIAAQRETMEGMRSRIEAIEADVDLKSLADAHPEIGQAVLNETAKLHAGDEENARLWNEFLPHCREDIGRIYRRLNVSFDQELGESFYHGMLADVVQSFQAKGLCQESEGALCVFVEGFDTPMIVQKKDGAYLYATTDLATIKYRIETWNPDAILYVVDHRQAEHFQKLFDAARLWGYDDLELTHVSFGTVLGDDGKPFKTRSGDTVGLEGLLDEAERRAAEIVNQQNPELPPERRAEIARVIGIGALKYADLSQNRQSDYKFSYDKMLALKGNTATYLQYSYARVQGILRKGDVDLQGLRANPSPFRLETPIERQLAIGLLRFSETLDEVLVDYKPNVLCQYLFELTQTFFQFYDQCPVLNAEDEALIQSRLQFCDMTARTIQTGLDLLGIGVVDQM